MKLLFVILPLLFVSVTVVVTANLFTKKKSSLFFDQFMAPCPGNENTTIQYKNVRIRRDKTSGNLNIDYDIIVHDDLGANIKLLITVQKCKSREALDTCVKFTNFNSEKYCQIATQSTEVWSPFVKCIKPAYRCPLMKGKYEGRDCFLDMEAYKWFPLEGSYWRFNVIFKDVDDSVLGCGVVQGVTKPIN